MTIIIVHYDVIVIEDKNGTLEKPLKHNTLI